MESMKRTMVITLAAALLSVGSGGVASAATADQTPPPASQVTTFHCPGRLGTFKTTADPWVTGQYEWYFHLLGCTYT
jgi:hypothetical protein